MEYLFIRIATDPPSFHLGTEGATDAILLCGQVVSSDRTEAIASRVGGVSCAVCAQRASAAGAPITIQLEELPVEAKTYIHSANGEGEQRRAEMESAARRQLLENLFAAAKEAKTWAML